MDKRKLGILIIAIVLVIIIAYIAINNSESKYVNDNDTFVVGFDSEYPPLSYVVDGKSGGFELDLAQEIANRNGWKMVAKEVNWNDKDDELNSGKIDCYLGGFSKDGRESDYAWTNQYLSVNQGGIVKSDSNINSITDLAGKRVEVQENTTMEHYVEEVNKNLTNKIIIDPLVSYRNVDDSILDDLNSGTTDAIIVDELFAHNTMQNKSEFKYFVMYSENYAMAFKLGNTDLRDKVQETLNQLYEDGSIIKLAENYSEYKLQNMIIPNP